MSKIFISNIEEMFIDRVRKEGFGFKEALGFIDSDFPKYLILRVALARALRCPKIPLDSYEWGHKKISGEAGGKKGEYYLAQVSGKGAKDKKEDFDIALRGLLYVLHKEELDRDNKDIFSDDEEYVGILGKYISRGLYEIHNSWKSSDCIYQWCLDNLGFGSGLKTSAGEDFGVENGFEKLGYFAVAQKYFNGFAIPIGLIDEYEAYRHHICKIELTDSSKIEYFERNAKYLSNEFGTPVLFEAIDRVSRGYNIQIAKPETKWQNLGLAEFRQGLEELKKHDCKLGVYAGNDIDKSSFCFDLAGVPHCLVAGTTGSDKTKFIQTMIVCLLQNPNVEITVIDPKGGIDFRVFGAKINLITDMQEVGEIIENLIDEMNERNAKMSETGVNNVQDLGLNFKVLIIDELNNLVENDKTIKDKLARLAEMARQAGIHLVLGTQRPDGTLLKGLRNNIDGKIALRVGKESESRIILDDSGAEKLLGKGDMLIKVGSMPKPKHIFSVYLSNDEIKGLI